MIIVRQERKADLPKIRKVLTSAFGRENEAEVIEVLHGTSEAVIALVAFDGDELVGHVLLSPVWLDDDSSPACFSIGLLAVQPEHQGRGIGTALVRHALQVCRRDGKHAVVGLGFPEYYKRFGFTLATEFGLGAECAFGRLSSRGNLCR